MSRFESDDDTSSRDENFESSALKLVLFASFLLHTRVYNSKRTKFSLSSCLPVEQDAIVIQRQSVDVITVKLGCPGSFVRSMCIGFPAHLQRLLIGWSLTARSLSFVARCLDGLLGVLFSRAPKSMVLVFDFRSSCPAAL